MTEALIGWGVILGAIAIYTERTRHPARSRVGAYCLFLAVLGAGALGVALVFAGIATAVEQAGKNPAGLAKGLAPIISLGVIVPLWLFASRLISRPPH